MTSPAITRVPVDQTPRVIHWSGGTCYLYERQASAECPGGVTVSRHRDLPFGGFYLTEYRRGPLSLWFVDCDEFTADEREAIFQGGGVR